MASQPDPYAATYPKPGKPIVKSYPTPDLTDRIFVVRKDSRAGGYVLPAHGDKYDGPEAQKLEGFVFATAVPSDQTGWVDWYYLDERSNEDTYNAIVTYPYVDKDYPQVTRTYTRLRTEASPNLVVDDELSDDPSLPDEPAADSADPVYPNLLLIDHKVVRFDDPVLDSIFVNVQRVYERLPSPIIRSYEQSPVKQIIAIDTQEVVTENVPTSSALTEVLKVERTTTAKAKVTTGTVPDVFPADAHLIERPDLMPPEFRGLIPTVTEALDVEGDAVLPTLGTGELAKSEAQKDEFVKRTSVTKRADVPLPKTMIDKDIEHLSQGRFGEGFSSEGVIEKTVAVGDQNLEVGKFVTDAEVKLLGDGNSEKITHKVTDWPILFERTVDPQEGIAVNVKKQVIDPLNAAFGPIVAGYVDVMPYDRWRSIQITSKVDLNTLPPDLEYGSTQNYSFPDVLLGVTGEWEPTVEYSSTHQNDDSKFARCDVIALSSPVGNILIRIAGGYSGPVRTRIVRKFLPNAPGLGNVPIPTLINPVHGTAYIRALTVKEEGGDGTDYAHSLFSSTAHFIPFRLGPVLTGNYFINNPNFATFPVTVQASVTDDQGLPISVSRVVSTSGRLVVDIPLSTPGVLTPGTEILIAAPVTRWRFGLFVQELIYAR